MRKGSFNALARLQLKASDRGFVGRHPKYDVFWNAGSLSGTYVLECFEVKSYALVCLVGSFAVGFSGRWFPDAGCPLVAASFRGFDRNGHNSAFPRPRA
ncbi:MAG: hypothetical protein QXT77_05770 [Candidatus Methanomethylicaceae archaeon]